MTRQAVLVVDMIADFVDGKPPVLGPTPNRSRVVERCRQVIHAARKASVRVIYVNDRFEPHEMKTSVEYKVVGEHAVAGTPGAEVIPELRPTADDFVISKKRYSAFPGTHLDLLLRELGIQTVVVIGIQTNVCVQHTVCDAYERAYDTVVIEDACDTNTDEEHQAGLRYMEKYYRTRILRSEEWIQSLGQSAH